MRKYQGLKKIYFFVVIILLISAISGCDKVQGLLATPTPTPAIMGNLLPWRDSLVADRQLALCEIIGDQETMPINCLLLEDIAVSDSFGQFQFQDIAPGKYLIIYDSGLSEFDTGIQYFGGEILEIGDIDWILDNYTTDFLLHYDILAQDDLAKVSLNIPEGAPFDLDVGTYSFSLLLFDNSPFVVAHNVEKTFADNEINLVIIEVTEGMTSQVKFEAPVFGE